MVLTRIQASDFQDAGLKGNLSKLEAIAKFSASSNPSAVDIVGDVFDAHLLNELVGASFGKQTSKLLESKPELTKRLEAHKSFYTSLYQKYGGNPDPNKITPEETKKLENFEAEIKGSGLLDAQQEDMRAVSEPIIRYYQECAQRISGIKAPVYYVRGNNDTSFMQEIVKGIYPELEARLIEDGAFRIIGLNNTNYPSEDIFSQINMGQMHVPPDWLKAYDTYNLKKTGKKANILMMHGPPNGFREGHDEKQAEGITKLIEEHTPDNGLLLVECGHFHKAKLEAVKSGKGNNGYVIARSSPNIFFEHRFDDEGNYLSSEIYKYSN